MKKKSYLSACLAIIVTAFIFFNSSQTAPESTDKSSLWVNCAMNLAAAFKISTNTEFMTFLVRKAAHVTEFFTQGFFISMAYFFGGKKPSERLIYVLFFGLFTACADELLQHFVEGRADMVTDIWIDFTGAALSAVLYLIISAASEKGRAHK